MEPPNKGHLGARANVPYSEVVIYSEVFGKIVFLHSIHVYNITRVFHEAIQSALPLDTYLEATSFISTVVV